MNPLGRIPLLVTFLALLSASAAAAPVVVQNPGFEAPAIPAGTFATTAPPAGWSPYGPLDFGARTIGVLNPATTTLYPGPVPEGANVGVAFLLDDFGNQTAFAGQEAGLQQTLTATLVPSTRYTLRVFVGNIADDPNPPHSSFQFAGFPGYRIDLLAGGQVLASDTNGVSPAEGTFLESTLVVDVGLAHPQAGQPLSIRLVNLNAAPGLEVNFDDVRLDAEDTSAWTDLGHAKAGVSGLPSLVGTGPLSAGSANALSLSQAAPSSVATLIVGLAQVDTPLLDGILVPSPQILLPFPTDAQGGLAFPFTWPANVPAATALHLQFWIQDPVASFGYSASNGLRGVSS